MTAKIIPILNREARKCCSCDAEAMTVSAELQKFNYLDNGNLIELAAEVPVWTCASCGDQVTDGAAEQIRHSVVCNYLGRLTPSELKQLRERNGLSQSAWAHLTGLGIASIKRWESGALIQSQSHDLYLRLLMQSRNVIELRRLAERDGSVNIVRPIFRTELPPSAEIFAESFELRVWH